VQPYRQVLPHVLGQFALVLYTPVTANAVAVLLMPRLDAVLHTALGDEQDVDPKSP
jgi:hypothetical protein